MINSGIDSDLIISPRYLVDREWTHGSGKKRQNPTVSFCKGF